MNIIALADRLGRTIEEIELISIDEYNEWLAYFKITEERSKHGK
jgi:hypothetical protein